jgi:hypothetical protein
MPLHPKGEKAQGYQVSLRLRRRTTLQTPFKTETVLLKRRSATFPRGDRPQGLPHKACKSKSSSPVNQPCWRASTRKPTPPLSTPHDRRCRRLWLIVFCRSRRRFWQSRDARRLANSINGNKGDWARDYCRTNLDRHGLSRRYYTGAESSPRPSDRRHGACRTVRERVCMLAALRCVSPALSESATPSAANFFAARTAIVLPRASSPAGASARRFW